MAVTKSKGGTKKKKKKKKKKKLCSKQQGGRIQKNPQEEYEGKVITLIFELEKLRS